MYRPESGIAEEFINDQEIKDTLAYADANKDNKDADKKDNEGKKEGDSPKDNNKPN